MPPTTPVPQQPAPPPQLATNWWAVLAGVLLLVIVGGAAAWAYTNYKPAAPLEQVPVTTESTQPPAGWKLYENREIGVAFEYPEIWGEIQVSEEVGECQNLSQEQMSDDPCKQVRLGVPETGLPGSRVFLSVQTPLHKAHTPGRGPFFGDIYVESKRALGEHCNKVNKELCGVHINSNGVVYVKDSTVANWDTTIEAYFIRSPHPYYGSVVLSAALLSDPQKADFSRLVDTFNFIAPNRPPFAIEDVKVVPAALMWNPDPKKQETEGVGGPPFMVQWKIGEVNMLPDTGSDVITILQVSIIDSQGQEIWLRDLLNDFSSGEKKFVFPPLCKNSGVENCTEVAPTPGKAHLVIGGWVCPKSSEYFRSCDVEKLYVDTVSVPVIIEVVN